LSGAGRAAPCDFVLRRQGARVVAGFHERASPLIVDIGTCIVARPSLNALLEPLRARLAAIPAGWRRGRRDRE